MQKSKNIFNVKRNKCENFAIENYKSGCDIH